jgi:hypothetical protein
MPLNFSNSIIAGRLPAMRRWLVTEFDGAGFGFMLLHTHSYCNTDNSDIILQSADIMVSQQQYYTQAPRQFYHQTPQQHGAGDNTNRRPGNIAECPTI